MTTTTASTTDTMPAVLTVADAQKHLRIGKTALLGLLHSGRLHAVRSGRRWLIPSTAITAFLAG